MDRDCRICIKILFMIGALLIGICCGPKVHAEDSASDTAYQEFLEGRRMLHIDEEMHNILKELPYAGGLGDLGCGAFSMKELLKKINTTYYEDEEGENNRIAYVEYAYLECGSDGSRKLAVRFDARMYVDEFELTFIIVYKDGRLYLRHAMEAWSRNLITLNKYGYIWNFGSGGAFAGGSYEALINDSGRADYVFDRNYFPTDIEEPEICQQVYGIEEYSFMQVRYRIQEKEYLCLFDSDGEELDDDNFIKFKKLYEKKNGKIYTQAEIDKLIEKRKKKLGITEAIMDMVEPDWNRLEMAVFKEQVREIELKEIRKSAKENNDFVVTKGWDSCSKENINHEQYLHSDLSYSLQYDWNRAIEYALEDYVYKKNISDTEWTLLQATSYGDMLHAVTIQSSEGRTLCLMLCSDAAEMGLPEYTEYLTVIDCYQNEDGMIYDSALSWDYFEPRKGHTYSFEVTSDRLRNYHYAEAALKHYLTDQEADISDKWETDDDTICGIGLRMMIIRFISEGQEIIMAVDSDFDNPRFSVIMKKGIKKQERSDWEKAYDQIEWGNWSGVQNFDEPDLLVNVYRMTWLRRDLNHDKIPELLCLSNEVFGGDHLVLQYIFTYHDNNARIVFSDRENDSEYYFLGQNGNLLCDYCSYAVNKYHSISRYKFDTDWVLQKQERLEVVWEADENSLSCMKEEPLVEEALSFNGEGGEEWNVTPISANVFLEKYQQMTGEDFLKKGNDWEQIFEKAGNTINGSGFSYGNWTPDTTENEFVKAVKKCEDFKENCSFLTYAADYDGDGAVEAFVVMGKEHYEKKSNLFSGESLWFVNGQYDAVKIDSIGDNAVMSQYIKKGNSIYFFFEHCGHAFVRSWNTPVYTVQNNQAVCIGEELSYTYKYINQYGQIMMEQDSYDAFYEGIREDGGEPFAFWTGHTWKYYPIRLVGNSWLETGARELSAKEVEAISPIPFSVQKKLKGNEEQPVVGVQYLLRSNGDLNINYVSGRSYGTDELNFHNITLRLSETNQWVEADYNRGTYMVNYSEGKKWNFLENLDKKLDERKAEKRNE